MNNPPVITPHWSTASVGQAHSASATELAALGLHFQLCRRLNGRLLALQPVAWSVRGFVTAHFVTTLAVLTLLAGVFCPWF